MFVVGTVTVGVLTIVVGVAFCVVLCEGIDVGLCEGIDVDVVFQPGVVYFDEAPAPSPLPFHDVATKS